MALDVQEQVARALAAALPADGAVLAMVSGGADSMCLLHLLQRHHPGRIGVLAVDHGLRPGSAGEAAAVADAARALGLESWVVALRLEPGAALHARARDARYAAARELAARHGFDRIATGHTATDQAETVLFRIARGTGRTGALGMRPDGAILRPLLGVDRSATRAWCDANGVAYVDDPSNGDPRYARTRVRDGLVPALEAVHPGASRSVARFAELLADEAEVLRPIADAAWGRCAVEGGLAPDALGREPAALARLLVRRLLAAEGIAADARWVERVRMLAAGGGRLDIPGAAVAVERGVLRVVAPVPAAPPPLELPVPGAVDFAGTTISARPVAAGTPSPEAVDVRVDGPLLVRGVRPGDRLRMSGGGRRSVSRLLAEAGVPARRRHLVPVVATATRVVWVSGYRADPDLLAPPGANAIRLELA